MATARVYGQFIQQLVAQGLTTVDVQVNRRAGYDDPVEATYFEDLPIERDASGYVGDPPEWHDGVGYYVDVEYTESGAGGYVDVVIGKRYEAVAETLDLEISQSSTNKTQNVARVSLKVENTMGIEVGSDEAFLTPIRDADNEMVTGEEELHITGSWEEGAAVVIKQTHHQPATILCLTANVGVSRT